jgi:hypothetical protein
VDASDSVRGRITERNASDSGNVRHGRHVPDPHMLWSVVSLSPRVLLPGCRPSPGNTGVPARRRGRRSGSSEAGAQSDELGACDEQEANSRPGDSTPRARTRGRGAPPGRLTSAPQQRSAPGRRNSAGTKGAQGRGPRKPQALVIFDGSRVFGVPCADDCRCYHARPSRSVTCRDFGQTRNGQPTISALEAWCRRSVTPRFPRLAPSRSGLSGSLRRLSVPLRPTWPPGPCSTPGRLSPARTPAT